MSELFDKIFGSFPEMRLMKEELMAKHTTFRIGGPAEVYACPNQEQLPALLEAAKKENAEVTVIGNGSNLLGRSELHAVFRVHTERSACLVVLRCL